MDHTDIIHEGVKCSPDTRSRVGLDIEALRALYETGQRAHWQLAISPLTYLEVMATRDDCRRTELADWFFEVWEYWREFLIRDNSLPTFAEAEQISLQILSSDGLRELPGPNDRALLCDAILYGCDAFCTRDWSTILRHRKQLTHLPISILTPVEWWNKVAPWSAIWW